MKSTSEDTVELTLNTSHNSGSETAADSSTFQPSSQHIKYASFAEIIVCIPYESKYQSPFQQTGIFSTFAVNDKNIQLNWSMGVQISWTVEVAGTPSAWTRSVKPTQLLTFPRKWTQEIGSCFPFPFFPLSALLFLLTFETYVPLYPRLLPPPSPTVNPFIAWFEEETSCHWFILYPEVICQKSQAQWVIRVIYLVAHYCLIQMKNKVVWVLKWRTLVNQTWCYMLLTSATWEVDMGEFEIQGQLKEHRQGSISKYCSSRK